jgi:DNA-binding NarL/FixJ family response regulator
MSGHPGEDPPKKITILIADDHEIVRDGMSAIIGNWTDMEVVACAKDGREAVEQWEARRPDITLLDLRMPEMDGVGAIRQIRQRDPQARIIVLTTFDDDENIYQGMTAGAKAYLLKDASREEILDCIHRVHRGEVCLPPSIAGKLAGRLSRVELTERELTVLAAIARGQRNKEIAASLFITETTVKTHLRNIFAKLNVLSRTEAIATATRQGLLPPG